LPHGARDVPLNVSSTSLTAFTGFPSVIWTRCRDDPVRTLPRSSHRPIRGLVRFAVVWPFMQVDLRNICLCPFSQQMLRLNLRKGIGDAMKEYGTRSTFRYRRVAGSHHHTYRVDIRGLAYRISLGGHLVRRGAAGMLSEDADIKAVIKAFAINDIENLVGINDR
jgi:hypothetical protein